MLISLPRRFVRVAVAAEVGVVLGGPELPPGAFSFRGSLVGPSLARCRGCCTRLALRAAGKGAPGGVGSGWPGGVAGSAGGSGLAGGVVGSTDSALVSLSRALWPSSMRLKKKTENP